MTDACWRREICLPGGRVADCGLSKNERAAGRTDGALDPPHGTYMALIVSETSMLAPGWARTGHICAALTALSIESALMML